jgi:hypothetical protein
MGISIDLSIIADCIDPQQWADVYDESLRLLQTHPARLLGLHCREIAGTLLGVYCGELETLQSDPLDRHWCVVGARETMITAETHRMYRNLDKYLRNSRPPKRRRNRARSESQARAKEDILLCELENLSPTGCDSRSSRDSSVLGNKTQGTAIHIPLLAVAILVEDRFGQLALAGGDIDRGQAETARALAESVVGRPIALPVMVDAPRLLTRLSALLSGDALMTAFEQLYIHDSSRSDGALAALLAQLPRKKVERWLVRVIAEDSFTLGTVRLFVEWLNATGDVQRLCELGCASTKGARMDPEEFIDTLARTWVAVPEGERGFFEGLDKLQGEQHSTRGIFARMLVDDYAVGRHLRGPFAPESIRAALQNSFGQDAEGLWCQLQEDTKQWRELIDSTTNRLAGSDTGKGASRRWAKERLLITRSIDDVPKEHRTTLSRFGKSVHRLHTKLQADSPKRVRKAFGDADCTRASIARALEYHGPTLSEWAWEWLMKETDLRLLHFALTLVMTDDTGEDFCTVQRALLENRGLCRFACDALPDT